MKIRNGFVSNSSSSSFVCQISGEEASGWDMGLSDAGMYQCVNGHTMCESYVDLSDKQVRGELLEEAIKSTKEYYSDYEEGTEDYDNMLEDMINDIKSEFRGELPAKFCPCCNFSEMAPSDGYSYLLKASGLTKEMLRDELRDRFKSYGEFREFLKEPLDNDDKPTIMEV